MMVPGEIRRQIAAHHMLRPGELGLVAASGGADSTALLLALHELNCQVHVAHLDHALRSESQADADFVRDLSQRLGFGCTVARRDVTAVKRQRKLSLEAAAREVRYDFLRRVARREGAGAIFTGHTANDQVETFLLRLIRGAGVAGLSAMRPKVGLVCRPMLGLWRSDVEAYLTERGQPWREDASNRDPAFLRNRVRHDLLPLLATMNPGINAVLLREAELLGERQDEVEAEVLRRLGLNARQIKAGLAGKAVVAKAGIRVEPPRPSRIALPTVDAEVPVPGAAKLPGLGCLTADVLDVAASFSPSSPLVEYADVDRLDGALRLRLRRPGDRFFPLGMKEPKKLQDFFVDERVPREQRDRIPLLVRGDAIVWVVGMRIDERFKLTPSTKRVLRLRFEPD